MHNKNLTSYHHAGVELVRVPGAEKLRVRIVSKDKASAENEPDAPDGDVHLAEDDGAAGD